MPATSSRCVRVGKPIALSRLQQPQLAQRVHAVGRQRQVGPLRASSSRRPGLEHDRRRSPPAAGPGRWPDRPLRRPRSEPAWRYPFVTESVLSDYRIIRYSKGMPGGPLAVKNSSSSSALAMQRYQRSTQAFDDAVGRHLGLNPADLRCLDWLADGPKTAGQLAEATGLRPAATTTLIDRLWGPGPGPPGAERDRPPPGAGRDDRGGVPAHLGVLRPARGRGPTSCWPACSRDAAGA